MKLTVLGNYGPFPAAGGACSGYLVQEGENNILIDCGSGVLSNLQKAIRIEDIDAVILTHLHNDHMSDMLILQYAVDLKNKRENMNKIITVYAPSDPLDIYNRLDIENIFDLNPITKDMVLNFGNLRFTFAEMKHPVKNFAISIENKGKRFVYSGDTAWCDSILDFSKNADLLMLDAGLLSEDKKDENVAHLTAKECGIIAKIAGVKHLLLTHLWPGYKPEDLLDEAKENFRNVKLTTPFEEYELR
ncbi:MAG: MBL fold metallo-hydrolase [Firmicutes bacterium]|nr:MBL fold metallo-hydrolase [Bacillota bacterium]